MDRIIDTAHQSTTLLASSVTSSVIIISIIIIAIAIRSSFGERPVDESDIFNKAGMA